jgi:hypothetical protein
VVQETERKAQVMNYSEIFLIAWGAIATGAAVYFHHQSVVANNAGKMLTMMLMDIAEGRAVMRVNGGRISLTKSGATDAAS